MILLAIISLILIPIFAVLAYYIIIPFFKLNFYKKQGLSCYFYPIQGTAKRDKLYLEKTGDALGYYKELAGVDPFAPAVAGNLGTRIDLMLFDPTLLKDFFNKPTSYHKTEPEEIVKILMGNGLFYAEGEQWIRQRRGFASLLHIEFWKTTAPMTAKVARGSLKQLSKGNLENVNGMGEMRKIVAEVIVRLFFGDSLNEYFIHGLPLSLYFIGLYTRVCSLFPNGQMLGALVTDKSPENMANYKKYMDEVLEFRQKCLEILDDRKEGKTKNNDLIQKMLDTQKTAGTEDQFTDNNIVDQFITFLSGGLDSTSYSANMTLYLLSQNPESFELIEKDVKEVYKKEEYPSFITVNSMKYLPMFIKEVLRMYNAVRILVPRIAVVDHTVGHIKVKKGTCVRPVPMFNSYNPMYFQEPNQFKPERWLNLKKEDMDPYMFVPFAAGPRNCVAMHLALVCANVIVPEFLSIFRIKTAAMDPKTKLITMTLEEK